MSLFQAREWWRTRLGGEEEFCNGSLAVGNVDNAKNGAMKILTGSLQGMLRLHLPKQAETVSSEDLLFEQSLGLPILQLIVGGFVPHSEELQAVAVLHPRRLSVYSIDLREVGVHTAELLYKHELGGHGASFTAYNMCSGNFGGSTREMICVQSMDCKIQILDLNTYSFMRRLVTCLLPGPICYVPRVDSIVTANSAGEVECYRFRELAAVPAMSEQEMNESNSDESKGQKSKGINSAKKVRADWVRKLGDNALEIRIGRLRRNSKDQKMDILVVCEKSVFYLRETGSIRAQRKLDYFPSTTCLYRRPDPRMGGESNVLSNLIIGNFDRQLMVYCDVSLVWAAVVPATPVAIEVAKFGQQDGLIVTLDDRGTLQVNYLGTDPPSSAVVASSNKEINYEEIDEEHRRLLNVIREAQSTSGSDSWDKLEMNVKCPKSIDEPDTSFEAVNEITELAQDLSHRDDTSCSLVTHGESDHGFKQVTIKVFLKYSGKGTLRGVQLMLQLPEYVATRQTCILVPEVKGGGSTTPLVIPIRIFVMPMLPNTLDARVVAVYNTSSGEPRSTSAQIHLPLSMVCQVIAPQPRHKKDTYRLTLDTNKPPCELLPVFDDMLAQFGSTEEAAKVVGPTGNSVICFQYWFQDEGSENPVDTTILVSKTTGRYRVQSTSLMALWIICDELVRRLKRWFQNEADTVSEQKTDSKGLFEIRYTDTIPFQDFFDLIDDHFAVRVALLEANMVLNDRSHQLRLLQKRLLVRFNDRNPPPLNNLDVLMEETHSDVMEVADKISSLQRRLAKASNALSCTTNIIIMLAQFRFSLSDEDVSILRTYLTPNVRDMDAQGWEESVDAALTHLLKTTLAKSSKESTVVVNQPLVMPKDTMRLKRHIQIMFDRLSKGISLTAAKPEMKEGGER
uniref:PTHB1 N-terminal domain-containing protein n=1 Tax=Octactis speculum TaxID=3111310 RepID=A0A7S2G715_9STRA|mmetsp:Transcript_38553/g.52253  ORF Transcript_38553/g.52253 Transcript_38553/m.52253 type:complete len:906 (+) Transcript_38553:62-2779(+)|eukprot:CAMPEP_0185779094 /NCGR_PEP_ID=MMETSP1174-20130828/94670_1 /TAXON_ID=35687 /ORGANISM="Dictyocha speculum, Strain CCMP1381" /LENGTH=905 /DNA_ID=CAMNT_0028468075 /DNA_START=34 /DNA_END=2754 /DNA_ORIENTATION=+